MPLTLADGKLKVTALTVPPADINNITLAELTAGIDIQDYVLKSTYRLSPTEDDTVPDTPLGTEGNAVAFGPSNYEGTVSPFRYLDETGRPEVDGEEVWNLFREKGSQLVLVEREGPDPDEAWAAADEYEAYQVLTGTPRKPSDRTGYIKRDVTLGIQKAALFKKVAGAAV